MNMRIGAKRVGAQDLKPGDLFSLAPTQYWDSKEREQRDPPAVGEIVYIRTNAPSPPEDEEVEVTLITIHTEDDKQGEDNVS